VPANQLITIQDAVRGEVTWNTDTLGDFVIMRSNGLPVYNFCVAIDDALMGITHVLRAEEHLPNTLRQVGARHGGQGAGGRAAGETAEGRGRRRGAGACGAACYWRGCGCWLLLAAPCIHRRALRPAPYAPVGLCGPGGRTALPLGQFPQWQRS
jgi:hypothetical protein